MLLVKFDLKFGKSIKNKGGGLNLEVPGLFLRKIFKKFKIPIFFEKKLYLKKEDLELIQYHFLLSPTPRKKLAKIISVKTCFNNNSLLTCARFTLKTLTSRINDPTIFSSMVLILFHLR